jgi:hypothetical protein
MTMLERRAVLTGSTALLAAGAATGAMADNRSAQGMAMAMPMQECIDLCAASHVMCLETANYAADADRSIAPVQLIALLSDCAEICQSTANSMVRKSALHTTLCRACADACDICARECERQSGDRQLALCAATCRRCAASCRQMAAMAG